MLGGKKAACDLKNRVGLHIGHSSTSSKGAYTRVRLRHGRGPSFDHLVGAGEQRRRHVEAERVGSFEIDYQLVLYRELRRQVPRFCSLKDAINVRRALTERIDRIWPVGDQATTRCVVTRAVNRRQA